VPKTPLYERLQAEGRLLTIDPTGTDRSHYVGTAGGTNFHPRLMTRDELKSGQQDLYKRLYAPEAFAQRLLGNLGRFRKVRYEPERLRRSSLVVLGRLARHYWRKGRSAHGFFWSNLWKALRQSHRLIAQMVIFMGMYMHFCKVHAGKMTWDPWARQDDVALPPPDRTDPSAVAAARLPVSVNGKAQAARERQAAVARGNGTLAGAAGSAVDFGDGNHPLLVGSKELP
jgi:hypothetical protein